MKRFFCAVVLLIAIITASIMINITISKKAEELISITKTYDKEKIIDWWNENGSYMEAILDDNYTNTIFINIEKLKLNYEGNENLENIITAAEKIKDSVKLTWENIF